MSAFGLLRVAWRELWNRTQAGIILLLAFWYSVVTGAYQSFVASRLGPALPASLKQFNPLQTPGISYSTVLSHLSSGLIVRLLLVYATLILIVAPFSLAGLYSGVGETLRGSAPPGFFTFFRLAVHNFWRALSFILLALAMMVITFALVVALTAVLSAAGTVGGLVLAVVMVLAMMVMISLFLYWLGALFYGQGTVLQSLGEAVGWVFRHFGFTLRFGVLLLGLIIVTSLLLLALMVIPVLGPVIAIVAGGMIVPAFMAVLAAVYYREGTRSFAKPVI
ncbi:MAG: hypothetical protein M0Z53_02185 [Thermaerobacter sp.]|nr:hypothetical protein [Thermaerobacter sp.]